MKATLRPAELGDIPRMHEIEDDAGEVFEGWRLIDFDDLAVVSIEEHTEAIEAGLSFIADVDGRAVGFVMGVMHGEDAYLHELDVAQAHQKKGLGAMLVRAFLDAARARGARAVYLSTFRDPPWNAPFYARLGFREVARGNYLSWMHQIESQQSELFDIGARVFMRLAL